jgi:hypothetical protein
MSDYVEDNRIQVEEILKKIEPPATETKRALTLNSYAPTFPKPNLSVFKKKLKFKSRVNAIHPG